MSKLDVKALAADLAVGETAPNQDCPFCKSGEKSFSITRSPAGIVYNCHRAKCKSKGFIPTLGYTMTEPKPKKKFTPHKFSYPLRNFSEEELSEYFGKYGIPNEVLRSSGFRYDYTNGRVYMPIRSYESFEIGACVKDLRKGTWAGPKAVAYWFEEFPKLHYADVGETIPGWIAVVEGVLDAIKISQIMDSAALLGTHLSPDCAQDIRRSYGNVLVMLDPGAEEQAQKIIRQYKLYFDTIRVVMLPKDPKDTSIEELKGAVHGAINSRRDAEQEGSV